MASVRLGIVPESSETPPKPDDYVIVTSSSGEQHRMVRECARHPCRRRRLPAAAAAACSQALCAWAALQVKPYHFDFSCNVRQRWFGQNIIDIFSRVGGGRPARPGCARLPLPNLPIAGPVLSHWSCPNY